MKRIIPFFLALALAGCATFQNPFTTNTLAAVESSYGAALSVAVGYRDACAQRLIDPSCRPIVVALQTYGRKAQSAILSARNFVRNNPTLDAASSITAAQAAVNDFKAAETKYGVN